MTPNNRVLPGLYDVPETVILQERTKAKSDVPINPIRNVRSADPETSYAAAFANGSGRISLRWLVYQAICAAGARGCTDYDVMDATGIQLNSANKRRGELRDKGLVTDSGRRRMTPSGSQAIVWIAVDVANA